MPGPWTFHSTMRESEHMSAIATDADLPAARTRNAMPQHSELVVVPVRSPWRWVTPVLIVLAVAACVHLVAFNPRFQWDVFGHYLFTAQILQGLFLTLWLTAVTMAVGFVLGTALAIMRLSQSATLSRASRLYVWFFRGTPVLVQLIFWYNLAALFPTYVIGIPFGPVFFEGSVNDLITPVTAAILGLGLNEGAYMAEIVRAGIQSVHAEQHDAARALGMRSRLSMRRIILPQAMQFIVPPTGNETIGMLKTTSLVSVIALYDLLYSAQSIYSRTYETIPLLLVACFWYLIATSVLSLIQMRIERHFQRSNRDTAPSAGFLFWKTLR